MTRQMRMTMATTQLPQCATEIPDSGHFSWAIQLLASGLLIIRGHRSRHQFRCHLHPPHPPRHCCQ